MMSAKIALVLAALAYSAISTAAGAQPVRTFRLCVIDENVLLARSSVAKTMAERFQYVRNEAQKKYERDNEMLEADARALASSRTSLARSEAEARTAEIARRRSELRTRGEEINRDLAALDAELTQNVLSLAKPAIRATAAERGCSAVVARSSLLDLGDASLDVTAAVLARMAVTPFG